MWSPREVATTVHQLSLFLVAILFPNGGVVGFAKRRRGNQRQAVSSTRAQFDNKGEISPRGENDWKTARRKASSRKKEKSLNAGGRDGGRKEQKEEGKW